MRQSIRIALLKCDTPMPDVQKVYGDYYEIFLAIFKTAADIKGLDLEMDAFDVVHAQHYPSTDELRQGKYQAIVLTGSSHNAHDNSPWIFTLMSFLRKVRFERGFSKIRIIGICFGHQILLRACGGITGRNRKGWEVGYTEVQLNSLGQELLQTDKSILRINQFHRDHVSVLPADFKCISYTDNTPNHGTVSDNMQCLTIQGHPELSHDIMKIMIQKRIESGILTEKYGNNCLHLIDEKQNEKMDDIWIVTKFIEFIIRT